MALPQEQASGGAKRKAPTAYFIFSNEQRSRVRDALLAGKDAGTKVQVADVAKELGRRWAQLPDEEKAAYRSKAQAAAEAAEAAAHQEGLDGGAEAEDGAPAEQPQEQGHAKHHGLPTSLVKRIVMLDEDVERVSQLGLLLISRATELFIELLAERCGRVVAGAKPKRSTIKLQDFGEVLKRDKRLVAAGLRDVLAHAQQVADTAAASKQAAAQDVQGSPGGDEQQPDADEPGGKAAVQASTSAQKGQSRKRKAEAAGAASSSIRMRPITSFFAAAAPLEQ